jgi:hypothetical protein
MRYETWRYINEEGVVCTDVYKKGVAVDRIEDALERYYELQGMQHTTHYDYLLEDKGVYKGKSGFTLYPQ